MLHLHRIALLLIIVIGGSLLASAAPVDPLAVENEFLRVVVNRGPEEAGRYSIRTTGGDPSRPSSKHQHLIFGGNTPWTSYTTVRVDGVNYVFGGATIRRAGRQARYGALVTPPTRTETGIAATYRCGEIEVTQELQLVRGPSTRMMDTVGIGYRLVNHGTATHRVGLRVMVDTMCGSNDGAPIRAGSREITAATALTGPDVPDFWQAFDSLSAPTVISQGILRGGALTAPDQVRFADWGSLADEPWEPATDGVTGFIRKGETDPDTATALYWNPETLESEQGLAYLTYYGIGDVSLKAGNLALGLTAPADAAFAHERTETVTITGYLQNAGGFDARDVALTLALPAGLTLVSGSALKDTVALLKPGETVQASWKVRPNGSAGGKLPLRLAVTSANIEANEITRDMAVLVPQPTLHCTPSTQTVPAITNDLATVIPIQLNLAPAEDFAGVRFTLKYDPRVIEPLGHPFGVSRGRAFVENGRLLRWQYTQTGTGILTFTGTRGDAGAITQAEANLATIKFRAVAPGTSAVTFSEATYVNTRGDTRPLALVNGEVTVVAAPEP